MTERCDTVFAHDHPACPGHFPNNPIIPGALLLARVLDAVRPGATGAFSIRSAKFTRPVRPGDRVTISWAARPDGELRFDCRDAASGESVLHGVLA